MYIFNMINKYFNEIRVKNNPLKIEVGLFTLP